MGFPTTSEVTPHSLGNITIREMLECNYQHTAMVQMSSGSSVPLLRHHFWLVVRGMVKLGCVTIHGDDVLLGLVGPNEVFGESLGGVEPYEAITLSNCDLLCLSHRDIDTNSNLASLLIQSISQRQRQSQALLALMGLRRVEDRLRGFLEILALDYGEVCAKGLRLTPKLTHQEIASAIGTTRVTVTRLIGQLKDMGWLSLDAQRTIILSPIPRQ